MTIPTFSDFLPELGDTISTPRGPAKVVGFQPQNGFGATDLIKVEYESGLAYDPDYPEHRKECPVIRKAVDSHCGGQGGKKMIQYYFTILDDGDALVRAVRLNDDGNEVSYSDHSSEDDSQADGDGSACGPEWTDAQAWTKCDRERAESMLRFQFDAEAVANANE